MPGSRTTSGWEWTSASHQVVPERAVPTPTKSGGRGSYPGGAAGGSARGRSSRPPLADRASPTNAESRLGRAVTGASDGDPGAFDADIAAIMADHTVSIASG